MIIFSKIKEFLSGLVEKNSRGIILLFLTLIPGALYYNSLNHDFVWDDKPLYINEGTYPKEGSFENLGDFWIPKEDTMYIPAARTLWALAVGIDKPEWNSEEHLVFKPFIFHLFNLIIHIFNCWLVFLILRKILDGDWAAFAGALIFGIHPIQVESVAWISELRGLLCAFFGFFAIYIFMRYREEGSTSNYYISLVLVVLSMLSKPTGVVFPFIILMVDIFAMESKIIDSLKNAIIPIATTAPFIIISVLSESNSAVDLSAPLLTKFMIFLDNIVFYLQKIVVPLDLAATYGRTNNIAMHTWYFDYAGALSGIIIILLVWKRKSAKLLSLSFIIFLLGFITVSGLVTFYYQYWSNVADRYIYISMLGIALAFAFLFNRLGAKKILALIFVAFVGASLYFSYMQIPVWQNEEKLWTDVINKYPGVSPHVYSARGMLFLDRAQYDKALKDFNTLISIDSAYPDAFINRGNVYYDRGQYASAAEEYSKALKFDKLNIPKALYNRANTYNAMQLFDKAVRDYSLAIKMKPKDIYQLYSGRGTAYAQMSGRGINYLDSAISDFKRALSYNPKDKISYDNLQRAFVLKSSLEKVEKDRTGVE